MINLDVTSPESFIKTYPPEWNSFNRHHIPQGQKKSINPNLLTLPMLKNHPSQEGKIELIKELLFWRFKGEQDIHRYYKDVPNVIYKWKELLKRREYIAEKGVGMFIIKYLTNNNNGINYFIKRFYPNVLEKDKSKIYSHSQKEIEQLAVRLENEIKKIFNNWVDKYPKLTPKLPRYANHILPAQLRIYKFLEK